ncbi:Six-hairpin glycosidase-like protein [Dyella sp. BiH032]|uniref:alpha-L-rhamnosidase-related protein n=1 Tax=Dyella sp. BiH032 TaxID=3075430 RepID=UPI0028935ADB|nr:Six-hairpin glycosidase-like protein [Dyella sp. BiH032]WNL45906.1 Six-hairpin glycosidase-like protein [Dyella sp. BiH032]
MLTATLLAGMLAAGPGNAADWRGGLSWQGREAAVTAASGGGFVLHGPSGERRIGAQRLAAHTASPLFDGLFAMAQDDLRLDSVAAIRDDAFDHGQAIPCACFETGEKWHYVWTRDLSYSVDLALWRLDPARSRASLRFKLSDVRAPGVPAGLYPMQDTGSGGSWPISTDRIVWFLGARHLLDDPAFAREVWRALADTLAQDRQYAFDETLGLYRGETSFLDWREQTYPGWTKDNVAFIGQSFALSTNVLHYEALRLAAALAAKHGQSATPYAAQAEALKQAINERFWRADRGTYMSYIGGADHPVPYEAYDLLGIALAVTSGVAEPERARQALAAYPTWEAGSPVIWPERKDVPIYHNRAIWPFVSAYALRAARATDDPERIAHELRSLLRGAALAGSNMENFELTTQSVHVEDGALSGPVVDSPRQLWSVAGYLDMVIQGVFGLGEDGKVVPKLPVSLVPMLFGDAQRISLDLGDKEIVLVRPAELDGNLLVAGGQKQAGRRIEVMLKALKVDAPPLRKNAPMYAPATPAAPVVSEDGKRWRVQGDGELVLYVNGERHGPMHGAASIERRAAQQCFSVTRVDAQGVESLHSPTVCKGDEARIGGAWPRVWTAPRDGRYQLAAEYANAHGPINTGITAAVQIATVRCEGMAPQSVVLTLPHSVGRQRSTSGSFQAKAGRHCTVALAPGFNMSYLSHFAHYTGGQGGAGGPLNEAEVGDMLIAPTTAGSTTP